MNTIVVLSTNDQPIQDRSWQCHEQGEADKMVKWLGNNFIQAIALTQKQWEALAN